MDNNDKKDTNSLEPVRPQINFVTPKEGIFDAYSNFIDAHWSLFDVRIRFGQIVPAPLGSDHTFDAIERAGITVAWPEAKVLRNVLTDLVRRYEETNGEIKEIILPKSDVKPEPK